MSSKQDPGEGLRLNTQPEPSLASSLRPIFRAFRHGEYRLLFTAFTINQIGFWVSHISLQGLMADLSGNDPLRLGLLFFAMFVPAFLFGPLAGVVADRHDRKQLILVSYVAVAVLMVLLSSLTALDLMAADRLLVLAFLLGSTFTLGAPAGSSLAANVVDVDDLGSAISLHSAANNLTRVVGPAVAAPLIAARHFSVSFGIFGVAALIAAALVHRMRASVVSADEGGNLLGRIRLGIEHARERQPAVPALLTVAVLALFGVSHVILLPVFAEQVFQRQELFAWFSAAAGVGATFGAIATARVARPTLRAAAVRLIVYGGALGAFALSTRPVMALALQLVVGYCYFATMTGLQMLLQQLVDDSKRGRVMSLFQVAWAGLIPFGALAMGIIAKPLGVVPTLLATACVCSVYGLFLAFRSGRHLGPAANP